MATTSAQPQQNEFNTLVQAWADQYARGFYETAQATLDPLGGGESSDPRVVFLAACTQLRRLRFSEARLSLTRAQDLFRDHPEYLRILPTTVFARLPEAIDLLVAALDEGQMPDLRVSPAEFLRNPQRSHLLLTGHVGSSIGRYIAPRPIYQARSLMEAQKSAEGPPRAADIPSLMEPITIRDDSIVIRTEVIGAATGPEGGEEAPVRPPTDPRVRAETAKTLGDKTRTLETIQSLLRAGDAHSALRIAQQGVGRFPMSASVRESLAMVQEALGQREKAARTYLATAHVSSEHRTRKGRLERCLRQSLALGETNLTILREVLAAAQRADLKGVMREALVRLLNLERSVSDPIQRQSWARQLAKLDPDNPLVREARESVSQLERVTPAAGTQESIHQAVPELEILEANRELEGMSPLPGTTRPSPAPVPPQTKQPSAVPTRADRHPPEPPPMPPPPYPPERRPSSLAESATLAGQGSPLGTRNEPLPPVAEPPGPGGFPPVAARPSAPPVERPSWPQQPTRPRAVPPPVAPPPKAPPRLSGPRPAPPKTRPPAAGRPVPQGTTRPPAAGWPPTAGTSPAQTRPPSPSSGASGATYPCFYCGQAVSDSEVVCPHCSHQQPAFLQRRVRERREASHGHGEMGGASSARRIPESSLTRRTTQSQEEETKKLLFMGAIAATIGGWILGSSLICAAGFAMATVLAKKEETDTQKATGLKILRFVAAAGCVVGLGWGIPL